MRVPKGFDIESPAIEYLKMKGFYTINNISDEELQSKNCIKLITKQLELTKPLIDFLNNAL